MVMRGLLRVPERVLFVKGPSMEIVEAVHRQRVVLLRTIFVAVTVVCSRSKV